MRFIVQNSPNKHLAVVGFHLLLGVVMAYFPSGLYVWYYFVLFYSLYLAIRNLDSGYIILLLAYSLGFEIIGRMGRLSPYIPWELTKYITFLLVILALFLDKGKKSNIVLGLIIILLNVPAWLISNEPFERLLFSMMGTINLGLMVVLFYNRNISLNFLLSIFRVVLLPLISILVYITLKTPTLSTVDFELGANFDTTGGFGSNQISTILGIGMLLLLMAVMVQRQLFGRYIVDIAIAGYFLFRGLLSFSRGGILVALLAFSVFFYILRSSKLLPFYRIKMRKIDLKKVLILLVGFVLVFVIANSITHGALLNRYKGETGGTLRGEHEKSLNTITTGRWDIMITDLKMWMDYPFWGVGGGNSALLRPKYGHCVIAAHTEFSRLLAESGFFGLLINIIIMFYLPFHITVSRNSVEMAFLLALITLGVLTSFHAGMRTFVTPFFVGLSTIRIRR